MSDDNFHEVPSPEQLAELLPQYGIETFIAQGGMGAVYKGRQVSLDRDVAIKLLLKQFGDDPEFLESFSTEAKAMARLNHPNLLGVFDFGTLNGMPYIVMEYVDGGSLHEAAWNQAIEPTAAVTIVKGICDGLAHAHSNGIVHRDIKPGNILLTTNVEPKIADFGLAHAADSDQPGLVMGTPGYTAPEVFQDPNQAGQLADLYSVGVILHQLLTGIDPAGSMEPPSQPTGNLRLDSIWRKATHINPSLRYPSVAAMATDLEKWLSSKKTVPATIRGSALGGRPAAGGPAPYRGAKRTVVHSGSSGGGGGKGFLIVILLIVVVVVFVLLQKTKKDINEHNEKTLANVKVKVVEIGPKPGPAPTPPDQNDTPTIPDENIVSSNNDNNDQPDIPVVEEPDPEPEPEPEQPENLPPGDPDLREKAIDLILDARKKRDKELADNARALLFNIGVYARDAEFTEVDAINELKEQFVDDRIPPTTGIRELSAGVVKNFEDARAREESIDASHRSDLTVIRDAYVNRLQTSVSETTDEELKPRLLAQAERAEDLDSWVKLLSPDTKSGPITRVGAGGFPGKWLQTSPDGESQWIAHPDGRMEIVGETWKVTWEILEDGTLEVDWNKKRPYLYTRDEDGEGWTGTTAFGKRTTLTPGDWD